MSDQIHPELPPAPTLPPHDHPLVFMFAQNPELALVHVPKGRLK